MPKKGETTKKRPSKPFTGKEGVLLSKTNQPTPEAKKRGWEELRRERHLTRSIIDKMLGTDGNPTATFKEYIESLIKNANSGNPKAIDVIANCLEDNIIKVAQTDKDGNDKDLILTIKEVKL